MPAGPLHTWWVTDTPVPDAVTKWFALRGRSNHYDGTAVLVSIEETSLYLRRAPQELSEIDRFDPTETLAGMWADAVDVPEEEWDDSAEYLVPFGKAFPGLASGEPGPATQTLEAAVEDLRGTAWHIALVGVSRPADAIVTMGWDGAVNGNLEPAVISSVLRSWEERFDASVVAIDEQSLLLAVRRPPRSIPQATAVAAEHYALAPDLIEQGLNVESIAEYGTTLVGAAHWSLWWD
jgi:hypothetical protein